MNSPGLSAAQSIEPPSGMLAPGAPGQPRRFALCCGEWSFLLAYVSAASELPATPAGFETRYGAPPAALDAGACFDAMKRVRAAAGAFGNPRTLRSALRESPSLLDAWEAPSEIVTHTAWLAKRVADAAGMIASGVESALSNLPALPPRDQVETLEAWLFDRAFGPAPLAKAVADEVDVLLAKCGRFGAEAARSNEALAAFTNTSPSTGAALCRDLQDFGTRIPRVAGAIASFTDRLLLLEAAWVQVHVHMLTIGNSITEENVAALPFLDPGVAHRAVGDWRSVGHAGRRFAASLGCDDEALANGRNA